MYHMLRASEHHKPVNKPVTVDALAHFDPDLLLIWNNRTEAFEVHRRIRKAREFWLEGMGYLSYLDEVLVYVTEFTEGLVGRDDPFALIEKLYWSDTFRHGIDGVMNRNQQQVDDHKARVRATSHENWKHASASNSSQLQRAWAPFVDVPIAEQAKGF